MNLRTPRDRRLTLIADVQADAARLLETTEQDELKDVVRTASRDLTEAVVWLSREHAADGPGPSTLRMVDVTVNRALRRLAAVSRHKAHGVVARACPSP